MTFPSTCPPPVAPMSRPVTFNARSFIAENKVKLLRSIADWTDENGVAIDNLVWRIDYVPVDPMRYHPDDDIMPVYTAVLYYQDVQLVDPNDPGPVQYSP